MTTRGARSAPAELAPMHPEWRDREPFASLLAGDMTAALAGGERGLVEMTMATHAGMTTDEFERTVRRWMSTARHPVTGRLFTEMARRNESVARRRTALLAAGRRRSARA